MNVYTANVFFPGCLGPLKNEVVLAEEAETQLAALREELANETERANMNALRARHAKQDLNSIQQRLADAERREAELVLMLRKIRDSEIHEGRLLFVSITALIDHKPEAANPKCKPVVVLPEPHEDRMQWVLDEGDVIAALEAAGVLYERQPRQDGLC